MTTQLGRLTMFAITAAAGPLLAGDAAWREPARAVAPGAEVRIIADSTLRDVAVAVYHPDHPVIYVNPRLMRRLGPGLETFFLAHERAHIDLRHTRASALYTIGAAPGALLRQKELEADCLASRSLAASDRAAVLAAVAFFSRQGDSSYDAEHPTGARRAANILACLPDP